LYFSAVWYALEPYNKTIQHPKHPWAIASPDYKWYEDEEAKLAGIYSLLEIKTTSAWNKEDWDGGAPDAAHCQLQWQMGIDGCADGYCVGLVGGNPGDLRSTRFVANETIFAQLVRQGYVFMEMVDEGTPPDPGEDDMSSVLKLLEIEDKHILIEDHEAINLTEELWAMEIQKTKYNTKAREIDKRRKEIKGRLALIMDGASMATCGGHVITCKEVRKKGHTVKPSSYLDVRVKRAYKRDNFDYDAYEARMEQRKEAKKRRK